MRCVVSIPPLLVGDIFQCAHLEYVKQLKDCAPGYWVRRKVFPGCVLFLKAGDARCLKEENERSIWRQLLQLIFSQLILVEV